MKQKKSGVNTIVYRAKNGAIELRGDFSRETIWANRMQMAKIFEVNPQAISKHIKNIYDENELNRKATSSKLELVQNESGRSVKRNIDTYNLDIIIAVGYRINSIVGTRFRQWATKTLRDHITQGYTFNRKRISRNYDAFMKSIADIQALLPETVEFNPVDVLELTKEFASTWVSLNAYDKETLTIQGLSKKTVQFTGNQLLEAITTLKAELIRKNEATDIFAIERSRGSIEGIVGNVMQSLSGKPVYPSLEEKAAHLLYFIVKNHPFTDGNKRSGAFSFIWFLRKMGGKGARTIHPNALTALTLLVAESDSKKKEQIIALITQLIT